MRVQLVNVFPPQNPNPAIGFIFGSDSCSCLNFACADSSVCMEEQPTPFRSDRPSDALQPSLDSIRFPVKRLFTEI